MGLKEFNKSTVEELLAVKDRVRNLVNHWGEEGRYKEAVLKTIIKRFLPEQFNIGTGFVVRQMPNSGNYESSDQIDLIVYNTAYPVLFKEDDFLIVTPDSVNAIIEVKANLENQNLRDALRKANVNGKFVFKYKVNFPFFNGIFSFDGYEKYIDSSNINSTISETASEFQHDPNYTKFVVNHIAFNKHIFYKFWENEHLRNKIYKIENLSFAFFISNLIDFLSLNSVIDNENLWFPIDKNFNIITQI